MEQHKKKLLLLSSAEDESSVPINNQFVEELRHRIGDEISIEWHNYHNIVFECSTEKLEVRLLKENIPLSQFDFVYIKSYFRYSEIAGVIATYLESVNVPFVCGELRNHIALTKLTQLARLSIDHLPIPKTLFMLPAEFKYSYEAVVAALGTPFIFKSIDGSGGDENYLVSDESTFQGAMEQFPDLKFIAQSYIPNDSDYRVLIVGGSIELIIHRQRKDDSTHLNNTSQGADAELLDIASFPEKDKHICLRAAQLMGREIAGVDLMYNLKTGEPCILEVNASPQIGSGAYTEEKLTIYSNYFKNMLK